MPIENPSFLLDAELAATGGTAKAFALDALKVANGIALIESSYTDYRTAKRITLKTRPPVYNKTTGKWNGFRREITISTPQILADTSTDFQSVTIVMNGNPEVALATHDTLRNLGAQTLFDTDLTDFWRYGTLR